MSRRIRSLQYTSRWLTFGSTFALGGCALHGADRQASVAPAKQPSMRSAVAAVPTYMVGTPSFSLITSSEAAKGESVDALHSTAASFRWLFGERPAQIGVVVLDTTQGSADLMPAPSSRLTTITLVGGGLAGPAQAQAAASLSRALRFLAANAWLGEYASGWSASVQEQPDLFQTPDGRPVPPAQTLPDWLHVGSLRLLAISREPSADVMDLDVDDVVPLRVLFAARLSAGTVAGVEQWLRGQHDSTADAQPSSASPIALRQAMVFGTQSASVLQYLRESQGEDFVAEILGASVGGLEMSEILASLATPTSPEQLDLDWRQWLRVRAAAAVSSPEGR
jgi:hypothetical protein